MSDLRDQLERLTAPRQPPDFLDELRGRLQQEDRAAARRWRRLAVSVAAVAVPALAAAAVLAATAGGGGSTVDRTVSCATGDMGGIAGFAVDANPIPVGFHYAVLSVATDQDTHVLLGIDTRYKGFALDTSKCRPVHTKAPLPLTPAGLQQGMLGRCLVPGRILVRLRVRLNSAGKALSALLAVEKESTHRPVAFVRWSRKQAAAYFGSGCR